MAGVSSVSGNNIFDAAGYKWPRPNARNAGVVQNGLWINLTVMELNSKTQSANPRAPISIANQNVCQFSLLCPDEVQLGISHEWPQYASITAKLADTANRYYTASKQIGAATKNAAGMITGLGGTGLENVVNTRVDSPLVYKTSNPITYTFQFEMAAYGVGDNGYMFDMINALLQFSSPKQPTDNYGAGAGGLSIVILPPNVFTVKTDTPAGGQSSPSLPLLYIQYAALTQIQPTYKGPYVNGAPMACSLTLTFTDITPLFATSFTQGSGITTAPAAPGTEIISNSLQQELNLIKTGNIG